MSGRVSAILSAVDPDRRWCIGIAAKRTYRVAGGGTLVDSPDQVPLAEEPVLAPDGLTLAQDTDAVLRKPHTDVVVLGHAYPHDDDRKTRVSIRIGTRQRELCIFGERRAELASDGRVVFTAPERFEKIPLGWQSAYGGYDAAALEAYGDPTIALRKEAGHSIAPEFGLYAYPRNPAGRG